MLPGNKPKHFVSGEPSTKILTKNLKKAQAQVNRFRLPSEAEWEYAARGGLQAATYPWGGPYTKSDRGCFMANFKPVRGDYAADQALYTVEAKSYEPNDYNLYNMAGNVAEWVNASYDPASYEYTSTINPSVNDDDNMRKVIQRRFLERCGILFTSKFKRLRICRFCKKLHRFQNRSGLHGNQSN